MLVHSLFIHCDISPGTDVLSLFSSGGRFMRVGDKIRLPDDVTMGYIIGEFRTFLTDVIPRLLGTKGFCELFCFLRAEF